MIPDSWKSIFKKEKSIFNQMVLFRKQSDSNFKLELVETFFSPYFQSLSQSIPVPTSNEIVIESFEILLTLIHKGYFKDIKGERETKILNLLSKLKSPLNENIGLSTSYLINTISKIKPSVEIKFMQRIELIAEHLTNIADLKHTLVIFTWISGHPEYRQLALTLFNELPLPIQNLIKLEVPNCKGDFVTYFLENPFGSFEISTSNELRYKMISGYPLLGGDFFTLPLLKMGSEGILVFANNRLYQLHFDLFGDQILQSDEKAKDLTSKNISPFWKAVITKIIPAEIVTSIFETDYYTIITSSKSYAVYIFYRVPKV